VLTVGTFAIVTAIAAQSALAQSGLTFHDVQVDVSPLRANAGDPTATWVQQELSIQLAQALAGRMARNGAPLIVRIDYLTLGPSTGTMLHAAATLDNINGVAIIGGQQAPVRATTSFYTSPIAQTMVEQSNHDRVSQLTQALAFWIARGEFF
jgi:predicted NBD/HSP70 family sugar kinase